MKLDNCYIAAWKNYDSGEAKWVAFTLSPYSKMNGRMPKPLQWLGTALLWAATAWWLLGHYLRFGTWPHFIYSRSLEGSWYEAVPVQPKTDKLLPPLLFPTYKRMYVEDSTKREV